MEFGKPLEKFLWGIWVLLVHQESKKKNVVKGCLLPMIDMSCWKDLLVFCWPSYWTLKVDIERQKQWLKKFVLPNEYGNSGAFSYPLINQH